MHICIHQTIPRSPDNPLCSRTNEYVCVCGVVVLHSYYMTIAVKNRRIWKYLSMRPDCRRNKYFEFSLSLKGNERAINIRLTGNCKKKTNAKICGPIKIYLDRRLNTVLMVAKSTVFFSSFWSVNKNTYAKIVNAIGRLNMNIREKKKCFCIYLRFHLFPVQLEAVIPCIIIFDWWWKYQTHSTKKKRENEIEWKQKWNAIKPDGKKQEKKSPWN